MSSVRLGQRPGQEWTAPPKGRLRVETPSSRIPSPRSSAPVSPLETPERACGYRHPDRVIVTVAPSRRSSWRSLSPSTRHRQGRPKSLMRRARPCRVTARRRRRGSAWWPSAPSFMCAMRGRPRKPMPRKPMPRKTMGAIASPDTRAVRSSPEAPTSRGYADSTVPKPGSVRVRVCVVRLGDRPRSGPVQASWNCVVVVYRPLGRCGARRSARPDTVSPCAISGRVFDIF